MRVQKGLVALAAGAILATTAAAYSAPMDRYYGQHDRRFRIGEAQEQRGDRLIRRGEELEKRGYRRQGERMERRGRQLLREGERHERFGAWEGQHER